MLPHVGYAWHVRIRVIAFDADRLPFFTIPGIVKRPLLFPLGQWRADQRSRMITEGASEVMRMVIAREVLKKYN